LSHKKIAIGVAVAVIIIIVSIVGLYLYSQQLPYLEVKYKTLGWYYTSDNESACLVLNLTITDKGYTNEIAIDPPLDFSLNISNVIYDFPSASVTIFNSSVPYSSPYWGTSSISSTLQYATLINGGSDTGTIIFVIPKQLYNQPFTLRCSITTNVKISKE
jgi:hypothetical protein